MVSERLLQNSVKKILNSEAFQRPKCLIDFGCRAKSSLKMYFRRETKKMSIKICVALGRVTLRMFLPLFDPKRKLSNLRIIPVLKRCIGSSGTSFTMSKSKKALYNWCLMMMLPTFLVPKTLIGSELANVDTWARAFTTAIQIRGLPFGTSHCGSDWCITNKSGNFNSNVLSVILITCVI